MPRILVVGGAGYIGSHMVQLLVERGFDVVTFDNLVFGHREAVAGGEFLQGDLSDRDTLERVFATRRFDGVMHFAAYAFVGESVQDPAKYYRNNVVNTQNLLDAMRAHHVRNFIFSSTCAIFGEPQYVPIDEAHPKAAINPYGRTKWIVEQMLADYDQAYGLKSICLRYFNAAGADPQGRIGEEHEPETHLIPLVLQAASGVRSGITVFGRDYDTPDGTCIRDYVHVVDLAQAHLRALEQLLAGGGSQVFNLGNGRGFSVQEVIDTVRQVTGRPIKVVDGPRRAGDPARLVGDSRRARELLGWNPQFADIATIVEHAWNWEQRVQARRRGTAS
jgi:UDP-glucose 4-epimerase